jgi:formate C-acetyltransferase
MLESPRLESILSQLYRVYDYDYPERRLERVRLLKEFFYSATPQVCPERLLVYTEEYERHSGLPNVLKRAFALSAYLRSMPIYILPGQLFVGNIAGVPNGAPLYPEYSIDWIEEEIDKFGERTADRYIVKAEDKSKILEALKRWKGRTVKDRVLLYLPSEVLEAQENSFLSLRGPMESGDGHITVDYEMVLRRGLREIAREAEERLHSLNLADSNDLRKVPFLKAVPIALNAAIEYAERYSRLCKEEADRETHPQRRRELLEMSEICKKVPAYPATTFHEALQSVLFIQYILQIESNGHSFAPGRIDQYLYPYYRRDIETKRITRDQALELLDAFFIMFNYVRKLRGWSHTQYHAGNPTYQGIAIGGQTPQGRDASNELTELILEAVDEVRLPQPEVKLRWFSGTPEHLLIKAAKIARKGFGMPAFLNDEVIVPSLVNRGISIEDARDYCHDGCVVPQIPGKEFGRTAGTHFLNLPKILLDTLEKNEDIRSYDELWDAFIDNLRYYVRLVSIGEDACNIAIQELAPDPFCSALVHDCIKRGLSTVDGGTIYEIQSGNQVGIQHVADSLMAMKHLIFEKKAITYKKLKECLKNDFEGVDGERIRQLCLAAPKYGNDLDEVDEIAAKIVETFAQLIKDRKTIRHGKGPIPAIYVPSTSTITAGIGMGIHTGATPDGRKAGEPLAEGISPAYGRERKGPTAVMRSAAKARADLVAGGHLLNLRLAPNAIKGEEGARKLASLIKAFFELKGWHVQFNVISTETLRAAQREPEKYQDIMVRVAGYCARFVDLDPKAQEYIINRVEHGL